MSTPIARPFPRFVADSPQEPRPYGRWEERLTEAFISACEPLREEAGTTPEPGALRFFPDRTWGKRTYVPVVGRGSGHGKDGEEIEFFGHISFQRVEEIEPEDLVVEADFTDVIADENPDWKVDLNDDVVGQWRADAGRGGDMTLIWGTPLVRGALAATVELDGEVVDQTAVNEGRFTLIAVDAVHGFGDDIFCEVKLWDRRFNAIAAESLYAEEDGGDEDEADEGGDDTADDTPPPAGSR